MKKYKQILTMAILLNLIGKANAMVNNEDPLDLLNTRTHIALPVRNLEETKQFYEKIFGSQIIAYGRSPGSESDDLLMLGFGKAALAFNEDKSLVLTSHFTMANEDKIIKSFIPCFHFGLFELTNDQFEYIKSRVHETHTPILDEIKVNKESKKAQKLMFIQDPTGYVIEVRASQILTSEDARTFEQQNDANIRSK